MPVQQVYPGSDVLQDAQPFVIWYFLFLSFLPVKLWAVAQL